MMMRFEQSFEKESERRLLTPEAAKDSEAGRLNEFRVRAKAGLLATALLLLTAIGCERAPGSRGETSSGKAPAARAEEGESEFSGYGIKTKTRGGEVVGGSYGEETGEGTEFSGYGINTKTKGGKVIKTPYGGEGGR